MSAPSPVLITRDGAVGILTVNRPETLNALDLQTLEALEVAATSLQLAPGCPAQGRA